MSQQLDALREFKRIPVLSALDDSEIFDFIRSCSVRRIAAGDALFRQGESGRSMFIIGEGAVDIFLEHEGRKERLATVEAPDVVGELALLQPERRSATGVATRETTVYEVGATEFDEMLGQNHPAAYKIARNITRLICQRIRAVNERIESELAPSGARPAPTAQKPRPPARTVTDAQARVSGTTKPGGERNTGGSFRRVLSRFWGGDE